jgi:hypothetical protein
MLLIIGIYAFNLTTLVWRLRRARFCPSCTCTKHFFGRICPSCTCTKHFFGRICRSCTCTKYFFGRICRSCKCTKHFSDRFCRSCKCMKHFSNLFYHFIFLTLLNGCICSDLYHLILVCDILNQAKLKTAKIKL